VGGGDVNVGFKEQGLWVYLTKNKWVTNDKEKGLAGTEKMTIGKGEWRDVSESYKRQRRD